VHKILYWVGIIALAGGAARGDSVLLAGGDSWASMPDFNGLVSSLMSGTPYWDNASPLDGFETSAGFFLTGTGGFASGGPTYYSNSGVLSGSSSTDYAPLAYVSQDNGPDNPDAPTDLSFSLDGSGQVLTLLANLTVGHASTFGYYDASQATLAGAGSSEVPIYGPGNLGSDIGANVNLSIGDATYGFYLTVCTAYDGTDCTATTTWFSNSALDNSDGTHQHFAVFDSSVSGTYFVAIKDAFLNTNGEGYGDFNDIIFELDTNSSGGNTGPGIPIDLSPEPGSLILLSVGLALLAIARLRK
jgi:hypothetical protein